MADIFSDDFGAGSEFNQSAEPQNVRDAFEDTESSTAAAGTQEPTGQATTAADQGDQGNQDGTQQQATTQDPTPPPESSTEVTDEVRTKLEQEAEAALSDPRTPKWFKNAVESVYKPKLNDLGTQVERYSSYGTPEEVSEKLGLLDKLGETMTDPITRMPIRSTQGFVQAIHEKDPEITQQLMADLAVLPAPDGSGQTVIQALFNTMGIDPSRLSDIQQFAQNGYQMQALQYDAPDPSDLALIPEHLRATFSKLSPDLRESLMGDIDNVRNSNLEAHRYRIETEERAANESATREQREQAQLQQQRQEFAQAVDVKSEEYFEKGGESVLTAFVDSLAKQANMSPLDSLMIANTMLNSLEPTLAGRKTAEAIKAAGVTIDEAIPVAVNQLRELSRHAAYYELVNDKANLQATAAKIVEVQERIAAKGNKLIAQLAGLRGKSAAAPAVRQAAALAATVNDRHAFNGQPRSGEGLPPTTGGRIPMDFSDEGYLEELRAQGFR